jgi:hypothetical protein
MRRKTLLTTLIFLLLGRFAYSQVLTDSNLPIIIINTDGAAEIPDDPRIMADMKIIRRGEGLRNYVSDENNPAYLNYNGRISIEVRGSTSQAFEKKQYGFSTKKSDNISNNDVSLLSMPADNDWILNCMIFDPSMIRNDLSFYLSRAIDEYSSRSAFCEVMLNGSYAGLYLLEEKIKDAPHRVNILEIKPVDNSFPGITGGYITKADKPTGGDPVAWTMASNIATNIVDFFHDLPKSGQVTPQQNEYIEAVFRKLESTASEGNSSFENGYPSVIDVPSFIDYMLLTELTSNVDGYQFSTFFHKDRNGKLRAGPLWDMDLTFGNDLFIWGADTVKPELWQFQSGDNEGPKFWKDLFNEPDFNCCLSRRWNQLIQPGQPFNIAVIEDYIDMKAAEISEAVVRENDKWGTIGDHAAQISYLKKFLRERIDWLTSNMGSYSACSDPLVPPLVITKIMYAPDTSAAFPDSKDLEFLEITNAGQEQVNLTGVYFAGTGFVYCFHPGSMLGPDESRIIAGNPSAFMAKYGFLPSGQFTRSLANTGEKLILADGFGNVIDLVEYSDLPPWPDVKFNGYYLKLLNPLSDNNIATNWIASTSSMVSVDNVLSDPDIKLYPSPVTDHLTIESDVTILCLEIYDILGYKLQTISVNSGSYSLNMTSSAPGIYLVRVHTQGGNFTRKIIRK